MALLARVAARGIRRRVRRPDRWPSPTSIHYYHFDGLGSVIALTNSSGSVVNLYEYSVYGEVSASDPNHPNRFLFTGREFDKDTGLYYYRARYYNPYIGRFLQTDPIGYGDGMNWYAYCTNNPVAFSDPRGLYAKKDTNDVRQCDFKEIQFATGRVLILPWRLDPGKLQTAKDFADYMKWAEKVWEKTTPDLPIVKDVIKKYFEAAAAMAGMSVDAVMNDKNGWRVFMDFETWEIATFTDGHQEPRRTDHSWAEVVNMDGWLPGGSKDNESRSGFYLRWEDAVEAGRRGVKFYDDHLKGEQPPREWFYDDWPAAMYIAAPKYEGKAPFLHWFFDPNTRKPVPAPR